MDELNPTVREQEIYEEMELTPEMVKSIRTLCGTCLRHFVMQRLSRSHLYPAQTGAWTPAPSARCGAATIMWSCTADPTIPPYLEQSPLRNIRQRALHITTWRYNCSKTGNSNAETSSSPISGRAPARNSTVTARRSFFRMMWAIITLRP